MSKNDKKQGAGAVTELARALGAETDHVRNLSQALVEQRAAIAYGDVDAVQSRSSRISRVLSDLNAARSDRRRILSGMTGQETTPLSELESRLGATLPEPLDRARTDLLTAAQNVTQELSINYTVLRRALETGEAFFQEIFSYLGQETSVYGQNADPARAGDRSAVLVNKVA